MKNQTNKTQNMCSNPEPHEQGSLPCCAGLIRVNKTQEKEHWKDYEVQRHDGSWTTIENLINQAIQSERERIKKELNNAIVLYAGTVRAVRWIDILSTLKEEGGK